MMTFDLKILPAAKNIQQHQPDNEPDVSILPHNPDDDQIALYIAPEWENQFRFMRRAWHEYAAGSWQQRDIEEMRRNVRILLRSLRQFGVKVRQGRINQIVQMLQDDLFLSDRVLNERSADQSKYINLRNGLFNLETFTLEPHREDLYFTTQLSFDYEPDAQIDVFFDYIHSTLVHPETYKPDQELISLVSEALAYSMTNRTDLKASFWLYGPGETGKSTMLRLIANLMGDLHTTIDLNQIGDNRFMLARIAGKRVATFAEADSSSMIPDGIYKVMVGGKDEIWADVKNRDSISFIPETKFWWAMNKQPRVNDRSGALLNRLHIIPLNRVITPDRRIGNLDDLLIAERPAIFNWLMAAYKRLLKNGRFTRCKQSEALKEELRSDNDTESAFVEECCDVHESYRISSRALYNAYAQWCDESGFKAKNFKQIRQEWQRLGFIPGKSNISVWEGVKLKNAT